jgi:hypothetical protein
MRTSAFTGSLRFRQISVECCTEVVARDVAELVSPGLVNSGVNEPGF